MGSRPRCSTSAQPPPGSAPSTPPRPRSSRRAGRARRSDLPGAGTRIQRGQRARGRSNRRPRSNDVRSLRPALSMSRTVVSLLGIAARFVGRARCAPMPMGAVTTSEGRGGYAPGVLDGVIIGLTGGTLLHGSPETEAPERKHEVRTKSARRPTRWTNDSRLLRMPSAARPCSMPWTNDAGSLG